MSHHRTLHARCTTSLIIIKFVHNVSLWVFNVIAHSELYSCGTSINASMSAVISNYISVCGIEGHNTDLILLLFVYNLLFKIFRRKTRVNF